LTEAEFVSNISKEILSAGIKDFPAGFASFKDKTQINLPGKTLIIGKEFFGKYEIITTGGSSIYNADDYFQAKFIVYANREKPSSIYIPNNSKILNDAVTAYENYLDSMIKRIETEYKKVFPSGQNSKTAVNEIFKIVNFVRY
jgi:hypothetical protein